MDQSDWESRWDEGRISFHRPSVSPFLEEFADQVWGRDRPRRVFVPLCGKSLDMVFLAERGAEVVGIEFAEKAHREFFAEQGLDPEVDDGGLRCYRAGPYELYAGDFFDFGAEQLGQVDAVLDRAALIALDPATRRRYAARMTELMPPAAKMLLITLVYEQSEMDGPPFAVAPEEVADLYGSDFEVEQLASREELDPRFAAAGVSAMDEFAFLLTRT